MRACTRKQAAGCQDGRWLLGAHREGLPVVRSDDIWRVTAVFTQQQQPVDRREGLRRLEQRAVRGACAADESRVGLADRVGEADWPCAKIMPPSTIAIAHNESVGVS